MKKNVLILLFILLLNSCFLAVTGAPHEHYYKEINGKNDLKLSVVCYYLNKTFSFKNSGFEDSIFIKSSVFKKPTQKKSFYKINSSDSLYHYIWRIGDRKYHKNFKTDIIEVIKITKKGDTIIYKFIGKD
ncbi:hypothetical protein [Flavobacterium sp.]|uniref:hypothetical protein n=1 Tax=Flavobacterium sp. TaxID=239 RepID=UPI003F69FBB9